MQNIIQYRTWQRGMLFAICAILLLFMTRRNMLLVSIILGIGLQFCFNQRRSWLLYMPIIAFILKSFILEIGMQFSGNESLIYLLLILVMPIVELGLYLNRRFRVRQYGQQINDSGMLGQLYISDHLLKESGLDDAERTFFKREIKKSYQQLIYLQQVQAKVASKLPTYSKDLQVMHGVFNELLSTPRQILSISDFLYNHFPSYVMLTESLISLDTNIVKVKEDTVKEKMIQTQIAALSKEIEADYLLVTEDERRID